MGVLSAQQVCAVIFGSGWVSAQQVGRWGGVGGAMCSYKVVACKRLVGVGVEGSGVGVGRGAGCG